MESRLDFKQASPGAYRAMLGLESYNAKSSIERSLVELVEVRASQINGCAFCLDIHSNAALTGGETAQRLYLLPAWRDAPIYTDRERAALAWTESLTRVEQTHVPGDVYRQALEHFSESELADLSLLVITINAWNRLMIAFRAVPAPAEALHAYLKSVPERPRMVGLSVAGPVEAGRLQASGALVVGGGSRGEGQGGEEGETGMNEAHDHESFRGAFQGYPLRGAQAQGAGFSLPLLHSKHSIPPPKVNP